MSLDEDDVLIRSSQDFVCILQEIKQALAHGALRQVKPVDAPFAVDDIAALGDDGPWPDYVEAYFESPNTRVRYKLSVETYHGAGGSWRRL